MGISDPRFLLWLPRIRLRRWRVLLILLLAWMFFVDGILPRWPLHFDRDLKRRFVDIVIRAESLESLRQHLNSQLAIRCAIKAGLAFRIGLDLEPAFRLLSVLLDRMHHHTGVADRFAVVVAKNQKVESSAVLLCEGRAASQKDNSRQSR